VTQRFKATKPRTQQGYCYHAGLVEDWSGLLGAPLVSTIDKSRIETFLAAYDDRPTTRRHIKIVLKMMLDHALDLGWIAKNPAERIKVDAPKSKVAIWEEADVEFYASGAISAGQRFIAAIIRTQWEIGQRITDVRHFRYGAEYTDGVFRFRQSKTGQYVTIPVSPELRALLDEGRSTESLYLFRDTATGRPFGEQRLGHVFIALRKATGGRDLTLRALRHSCVVQLARAGCTAPEIASITGHSINSVERILSVYLPRDNQVAWNAQAKRGLVKKVSGTEV
jgi:integrase